MAAHKSADLCIQQKNPFAGFLDLHGHTCRATDKMPKDTHGRRRICDRPVVCHVRNGFACGNFCKRHANRQKPATLSAPIFFDDITIDESL